MMMPSSAIKHIRLTPEHIIDVASGSGLVGMRMQAAVTMFTVNLKRILKLTE